jgi:lambda family phage portal protein
MNMLPSVYQLPPSPPAPGYLRTLDAYGRPIHISALIGTYEAAGTGRRLGTWGISSAGPSTVVSGSLNNLRSRSRQLIRNNPLVDGGMDAYVANIIGSGINPRWQIKDKEIKAALQELWDDWVDEADFGEVLNFYGLESLVSRGMIEAGEILGRLIARPMEEGLSVPLQIQILEADHLDEAYSTTAENGNEIRMGIEIDAEGKRVAYYLWPEHPGEAFITRRNIAQRIRIPASEIIHVFRPLRAGQMRGRPWLSSIIVRLHELDQYSDAELVRKKTCAMFGGFITENLTGVPPGDLSAWFGRRAANDSQGNAVVAFEPGQFSVLPRGLDVKFSQPVDVGTTYEVWIKQQLREIAKGMGVTYEQLTGDLKGVTYSSIRAGLLEFRRRVEQLQREIVIFQFCRRVSHAWMDAAVLSGAISIPDYFPNRRIYRRIKWRPDGWPWVDPQKDQEAAKNAVRSGFTSRSKVVAERGDDVETIDRENSEDNARADSLGLVYDTDPRKTGTGKTGAPAPRKKDDPDNPEDPENPDADTEGEEQ